MSEAGTATLDHIQCYVLRGQNNQMKKQTHKQKENPFVSDVVNVPYQLCTWFYKIGFISCIRNIFIEVF